MISPSKVMDRRNEKSKDAGENVDIEVLRKEYRNMQATRSAFAHESDLVSAFSATSTHNEVNEFRLPITLCHEYDSFDSAGTS